MDTELTIKTSTATDKPRALATHHRDALIAESGLTPETIEAAGLFTVYDEPEIRKLLNAPTQDLPSGACLAFPYPGCNGYTRLRPDIPRRTGRVVGLEANFHEFEQVVFDEGKPIKYESPRHFPTRLYIPANVCLDVFRQEADLWIVEGEKKALALCQRGIAAVAGAGIYGFHDVAARQDALEMASNKDERMKPSKDLASLHLSGRRVIILFDSDIDSNRDVLRAAARLGQMLMRAGALVHIAYLPPDGKTKVGVDDFLAERRDEPAPFVDIETSVRPFAPSEVVEWLYEQAEDWSEKEKDVEFRRAVQLAQTCFEGDKHAFERWLKESARILCVKQARLKDMRLPKEAKPKRRRVRDWFDAWLRHNSVTYDYGSQRYFLNGRPIQIDVILAYLGVDAAESEDAPIRRELEDVLTLWTASQDESVVKVYRERLTFDPAIDDSELRRFLQALTGKVDEIDLTIMKHFVWQVKRKLAGLKVDHHMMPVICGATGAGKSEAIKKLLRPVSALCDFAGDLTCLGDERQSSRLARNYVVFFDEMAKADRVDVESLKNKITSDTLRWRILGHNKHATATNVATFIGASNHDVQSLIYDPTGVRRFYQIDCATPTLDWKAINSIDVDQLWRSVNETASTPLLAAPTILEQVKCRQEAWRPKDIVEQWLDEECEASGDNDWLSASDCHAHFMSFQKARNVSVWSRQKFGKRLQQLVPHKMSNGSKYQLRLRRPFVSRF